VTGAVTKYFAPIQGVLPEYLSLEVPGLTEIYRVGDTRGDMHACVLATVSGAVIMALFGLRPMGCTFCGNMNDKRRGDIECEENAPGIPPVTGLYMPEVRGGGGFRPKTYKYMLKTLQFIHLRTPKTWPPYVDTYLNLVISLTVTQAPLFPFFAPIGL